MQLMVLCTGDVLALTDWAIAIAVPSISGTSTSTAAPSRNTSRLLTCWVLIVGLDPHSQGTRIYSFSLTLQSNQITLLQLTDCGSPEGEGRVASEEISTFSLTSFALALNFRFDSSTSLQFKNIEL